MGDFQGSSNIEAPETAKLYEAWYEHAFMDGSLTVLGGLHDYNGEFNVLEYGGLLMNNSFTIPPTDSQVTPPTSPSTSLALRVKYSAENMYVMMAVYDGVPGDPGDPHSTHIIIKGTDGIFSAVEVGMTDGDVFDEKYYKLALGQWRHSAEFTSIDGSAREQNQGGYLIGEKTIFKSDAATVGAFAQVGVARESRNQLGRYYGIGVNVLGLIPNRDDDVFGLAYGRAVNSADFLELNSGTEKAESVIELTYLYVFNDALSIQPNFQLISNPGMDPTLENAKVAGVRFEMGF